MTNVIADYIDYLIHLTERAHLEYTIAIDEVAETRSREIVVRAKHFQGAEAHIFELTLFPEKVGHDYYWQLWTKEAADKLKALEKKVADGTEPV